MVLFNQIRAINANILRCALRRRDYMLIPPSYSQILISSFLSTRAEMSWEDAKQYRIHKSSQYESEDIRKARLIYQSRKRGNLENGILLSTFADEYLDKLTPNQLTDYDKLINFPDNDWDIYYWATEAKEAPKDFQTDVLAMLQEHSKNKSSKLRNQQPPLKPRTT